MRGLPIILSLFRYEVINSIIQEHGYYILFLYDIKYIYYESYYITIIKEISGNERSE